MDIGGPYTADTPRFYVLVNGTRMKPYGKDMPPYRFTLARALQETHCTELHNKVMNENISMEPVEDV